MKKLLLILALLAYVAISCEDKPNPLTGGDEPETEQPGTNPADTSSNPGEPSEPEDLSVDTGKITIIDDACIWPTFIYNVSSDEVDFEASINSIFKHYTITLKDGSTPTWIGTNCHFHTPYSSDTGLIGGIRVGIIVDSLKYGNYFAITWNWTNSSWGPNYHNPEFKGIYHDIVLTGQHNSEIIRIGTDSIMAAWGSANNLSFAKY